jgi:hypothetical protein
MSEIKTNQISSLTGSNSDITLDPDGTGDLIVASGNVGIGTTSPGGSLEVYKAGTSEVLIGTDNGGTAQLSLYENNDGTKEGLLKYDGTNNRIHLATSGAPNALVIPRDSGNVGIGESAPEQKLHISGTFLLNNNQEIRFKDSGGSQRTAIAMSSNDLNIGTSAGGNLKFYNGSSYTERMRIDSSGTVMANTTDIEAGIDDSSGSPQFSFRPADGLRASTSGSHYFNKFNDGTIIVFRGQGTDEGNISINGTTISYNGGHLARWSQATDGNRIDGLVKGTVMTNLDQMAEWTKDGVTEDNEQLNCMAVSSVEGDVNVAGVFVNWDDDDEDYTADMNVAMTGDMVIRIASGTTVARGDLLMSAGDGTAKPQGDDIVRSKTIAKVTSTTVSHTYDDGSYLVPCVLMAC